MILLLDIGNSAVKWATLDDRGDDRGDDEDTLTCVGSRVYRPEGIGSVAETCWRGLSPTRPTRIVASNVGGDALAKDLCDWTQATWQLEVSFLRPEAQGYGVKNAYRDPTRLGADRWAALVGAARRSHGHLCVVDCGTAVTIDALSADNTHLGGLIVPGIRMMRHALVAGTAQIRYTSGAGASLLAVDTGSAVAGGTLYAVVALIDRVVADLSRELSGAVTILLTGGDAALALPLLNGVVEYEANLVMHGLAVVAKTATQAQVAEAQVAE